MFGEKLTRATALHDDLSHETRQDIFLVRQRLVDDYKRGVSLMPLQELVSFDKHQCQQVLMSEMAECLGQSVPSLVIENTAFWMSNAVNNEVQAVTKRLESYARSSEGSGDRRGTLKERLATPVDAIRRQLRRVSSSFGSRITTGASFIDLQADSQDSTAASRGDVMESPSSSCVTSASDKTSSPHQRGLSFPDALQLSDVLADSVYPSQSQPDSQQSTLAGAENQPVSQQSTAAGVHEDQPPPRDAVAEDNETDSQPVPGKKGRNARRQKVNASQPTPSQSRLRRSQRQLRRNASGTASTSCPSQAQKASVPKGTKQTKTNKTDTKTKKTVPDTNLNDTDTTSMLRCCMCMVWCKTKDTGGVWCCTGCRKLPSHVATLVRDFSVIKNSLKDLQASNSELNIQLASQTETCAALIRENSELRQNVKQSQIQPGYSSAHERSGTLLVGSSVVRDVDKFDLPSRVQIKSISGGRVRDICGHVSACTDTFKEIVVVVGGNDCSVQGAEPHAIIADYKALIEQAQKKAELVKVSSILPRTATKADAWETIQTVNHGLEELCRVSTRVQYVNNDTKFTLGDGSPNDALILSDGVHLTYKGTQKLLVNLGFSVPEKSIAQARASAKHTVVRPEESAAATRTEPSLDQARPAGHHAGRPAQQPGHRRQNQNQRYPQRPSRPAGGAISRDGAVCYNCGDDDHDIDGCIYRTRITCHRCKSLGHKANKCRR